MSEHSAERRAEVKKAVEGGMSYRKAAARFRIGFSAIGQRARKEGWKLVERLRRPSLEIEAMAVDEPRKTTVRAHKETMLSLNMESRRLVAEIVKDGAGTPSGFAQGGDGQEAPGGEGLRHDSSTRLTNGSSR
jgi:hypothetical protein